MRDSFRAIPTPPGNVRIAIVYDCLYPNTIGGAERWLRRLAEGLGEEHEVTYVTRRQWEEGEEPGIPGVRCVAVSPGGPLYTESGRRRMLPPLRFGLGVLRHFLRNRRSYDLVHCVSFPYFSLLAIRLALAGRRRGPRVFCEWLEYWTPEYWRAYLGRAGGLAGRAVQRVCLRLTRSAFVFSELSERRLREAGFEGDLVRLSGLWTSNGSVRPEPGGAAGDPLLVFAGRHIPEKGVAVLPDVVRLLRERGIPARALIVGDGPERARVLARIGELNLADVVEAPGFVGREVLEAAMSRAACFVTPSRREGHGMVAVEAAAHGAPVVVCRHPDNAALELVEEGVNGAVAAGGSPGEVADAVMRVLDAGEELRRSTALWFADNVDRLSMDTSIERVRAEYLGAGRGAAPQRVCMLLHKNVEHDSRVRREARALAAAGCEVTVVQLADPEDSPGAAGDGFAIVSALPPAWVRRAPFALYRLAFLVGFVRRSVRLRPDVIHAHDAAMLAPGFIASRLARAKLVYDSHELATGVPYRKRGWALLVSALERLLIRRCAAVVTVSDGIAARLEERYRLRERPTVVRNVSDLVLSAEGSNGTLRAGLGIGSTPLILHQGAAAEGRGCETLVRALALLEEGHLLFLGDGDDGMADRLAEVAADVGVEDRVHFAASVPLERLLVHTAEADVGVTLLQDNCENHRLALPNKLFEYVAAGIPVVASALPEMERVVEETGIGWTVDASEPASVAQGIRTALAHRGDPALADRLASARTSLTWKAESRRLVDLYASVGNGRGRG